MEVPIPNTFPGMFWGYLSMWILFSLYLVVLGYKVMKLEKEQKSDSDNS